MNASPAPVSSTAVDLECRQPDPFVATTVEHAVRTQRDDDVLVGTFAREAFQRAMGIGFMSQRGRLQLVQQQQFDRVDPISGFATVDRRDVERDPDFGASRLGEHVVDVVDLVLHQQPTVATDARDRARYVVGLNVMIRAGDDDDGVLAVRADLNHRVAGRLRFADTARHRHRHPRSARRSVSQVPSTPTQPKCATRAPARAAASD